MYLYLLRYLIISGYIAIYVVTSCYYILLFHIVITSCYYILWVTAVTSCLLSPQSLLWRARMGADTVLDEWTAPEVLRKYFVGGMAGHDREGSPVYVVPMGRLDMKGTYVILGWGDVKYMFPLSTEGMSSPLDRRDIKDKYPSGDMIRKEYAPSLDVTWEIRPLLLTWHIVYDPLGRRDTKVTCPGWRDINISPQTTWLNRNGTPSSFDVPCRMSDLTWKMWMTLGCIVAVERETTGRGGNNDGDIFFPWSMCAIVSLLTSSLKISSGLQTYLYLVPYILGSRGWTQVQLNCARINDVNV